MNGGGRFNQGESFQRDDGRFDEESGEDFVTPTAAALPGAARLQSESAAALRPAECVPACSAAAAAGCRARAEWRAIPGREFPAPPEGAAPRRRRRRPMGEHPSKSFNGRHSAGAAPSANGHRGWQRSGCRTRPHLKAPGPASGQAPRARKSPSSCLLPEGRKDARTSRRIVLASSLPSGRADRVRGTQLLHRPITSARRGFAARDDLCIKAKVGVAPGS